MYGKLFEQMYEGTLSTDWKAMITFQQMIILANEDGVVDMTPQALARKTGIPVEIIEHGLAKLEQPDKDSRTQAEGGRRIMRLDDHRPWGWFIVNYKKYRGMVRREDKNKADRERIARKRAAVKAEQNDNVAVCRSVSQPVADVAHTDSNTDTDEKKRRAAPPIKGGGAGASNTEFRESDKIKQCQQIARTHKIALRKSDDEVFKIVQEIRPETTREELQEWLQSNELMSGARDCGKSEL